MLIIPQSGGLANAGKGAALGSAAIGQIGIYCGPGMILCVPVLGTVGAVGGAVIAPFAAPNPNRWEDFVAAMRPALDRLDPVVQLQKDLSRRAAASGYHLVPSPAKAPDAVPTIKLGTLVISLEPTTVDINPLRTLQVSTQVSCLNFPGDEVRIDRLFIDKNGPTNSAEEWFRQSGEAVAGEVERSVRRLALQIAEELMILRDVPAIKGPSRRVYYHGIRPLLPQSPAAGAVEAAAQKRARPSGRHPVLATLTPTLAWEPLAFGEEVRYDVRVWRAVGKSARGGRLYHTEPQELVFEREGLATPSVTVSPPLEPRTWYFWSVRARFREGGQEKVTRWARVYIPPPLWIDIGTLGILRLFVSNDDLTNFFLFSTAGVR